MDFPELLKPDYPKREVTGVPTLLEFIARWREEMKPKESEYLSRVWYRGHGDRTWRLLPKLYRPEATQAVELMYGEGEQRRLNLEREILEEFRNVASAFLDSDDTLAVYFAAQHYGLPTRLLDWTTNPLVAAYFAASSARDKDGEILVMDASLVVQEASDYGAENDSPPEELMGSFVAGVRHPHAARAINESFWEPSPNKRVILPIRPDHALGRIGQQSSRFTLHRHGANPVLNPSLRSITMPASAKAAIRDDLKRLNISHHTIYNDLDHLAQGICESRGWPVKA